MAVLKQTSPTAWPVAPSPKPSSKVPSASTSTAVGLASTQPELACLSVMGPYLRILCGEARAALRVYREGANVLRDDINNALKEAMKGGDKRRVSTLRLINSALKNADIEARGHGKDPLSDDELLGLLQKMIKQRQESVELYDKGGRPELAQQERDEIAIIAAYLPEQMSDD